MEDGWREGMRRWIETEGKDGWDVRMEWSVIRRWIEIGGKDGLEKKLLE